MVEHFVSSVPSATLLPEEMPDACGGTALQLLFRGNKNGRFTGFHGLVVVIKILLACEGNLPCGMF